MVEKEFMNRIANGQEDILRQFLDLLGALEIAYCIIGGLAVNAYVEPVVSLDLDMAVAADSIDRLSRAAKQMMFTLKEFPHSLNLSTPRSDLRIQLQRDPRYQSFITNASNKNVMGYEMKVAALEDVIQGKIWAYSDEQRRKSKRHKDLADIFRLIESYPHLEDLLPESLKKML